MQIYVLCKSIDIRTYAYKEKNLYIIDYKDDNIYVKYNHLQQWIYIYNHNERYPLINYK